MQYVSKLFAGTLLLTLVACGDDTSTTGAGGGQGGSGPTSSSQGGGATTTSSGEGGASTTTTTTTTSTTGAGGQGGSGGEGGGGSGCTQITFADLAIDQANGDAGVYAADVSPNLGGADPDLFVAAFFGPGLGSFDGDQAGSFDLTLNGDDNLATCSRCLIVFDDQDTAYFQSQGTLVVESDSQQLTGFLNATVTGLRLIEVTIDPNTDVSTPVPNGACLEIASADLDVGVAPPAGWTCPAGYYGDGACDCGCGATDVDCAGDMTAAACEWCITSADGGCAASASCPSNIDPTNNAVCTTPSGPPAGWTCTASWYDDGDCDCGCGATDVDCGGDMTVGACLYCNDSFGGGCNTGSSCPGTIDPTNNALCVQLPAAWTCDAEYFGDGYCDCGCGAADLDCAGDMTITACDYCNGALYGGCNSSETCPGIINATNNAVCN
jgi:hypothetical protein